MVNVGGRPREHDRDKIALEMLEWAKNENNINLNGFCCTREPPISPSKITNWAKEEDNFRQAYEATKAFIAVRREEKLSNNELHVKAYDLNARVYDHFLKDEHRQQLEFESKLKSNETQVNHDKLSSEVDRMIKGYRDSSLTIADNINKTE